VPRGDNPNCPSGQLRNQRPRSIHPSRRIAERCTNSALRDEFNAKTQKKPVPDWPEQALRKV